MSHLTPAHAVACGHLIVNGPVFAIILGTAFVLKTLSWAFLLPIAGFAFAIVLLVGWLWWSFMVPRWRDWVIDQGLCPEDVEPLAVRTGLLWPRGSFFESTEFRRRNGNRGW